MKLMLVTIGIAALAGSAMANPQHGSGLVVLDPSAAGALSMVGNAQVTVPAQAVYVNSTHDRAVSTTGTAILSTPFLYVRGGASFGGRSHCTGQVILNAAPYADPFEYMSWPSIAGVTPNPAMNVSGSANIMPGYYQGISLSSQGVLTLLPGTYIIGSGGLSSNGGKIVGEGVTILMMSGSLNLGGNVEVSLKPPAPGMPYAGMVLAQHPSNSNGMSMSGRSQFVLEGAVYAPSAKLTMVGTSNVEGEGPHMGDLVVVKQVELKGTAEIRIGRAEYKAVQLPSLPLFD